MPWKETNSMTPKASTEQWEPQYGAMLKDWNLFHAGHLPELHQGGRET